MKNNNDSLKKIFIRPFTYVTDSVSFDVSKIFVLLLIQFGLLIISKSLGAVLVIIASVCGCLIANLLSKKIFNSFDNHFSYLICAVQGMITGMLVPDTYSPVVVFFVTLLSMLVVKHFFGGFSFAWANPAAFTVIVLWIIGASCFPKYQISLDLISLRNPSQIMLENGIFKTLVFDSDLTETLNGSIFSIFKVSIPEGYVSLFWDTKSSIPAFRFNFVTLISSIIIFSDNFYKIIVPAFFVSVYVLLVRFISPVICNGVALQGDMLLCLLTGGTLFIAVFVLNWYGTTPVSVLGKILYGFICGIIAFLIAGPGTSPCGMVFTVIIANIVSIAIQQWESRRNRNKLRKKLVYFRNLEKEEMQEL